MAIITAAGLVNLNDSSTPFNKNGSVVTLKKISETDWLLFGDIAEGDSEGFGGPEGFVIKTTDGVVAVIEGPGEVPGTGVTVTSTGVIDGGTQLEEVVSWPVEKPDWLEGDGFAFDSCTSLTKVPNSLPAWITDTSYMFAGCSSFNQDISGWDISSVTDMRAIFSGCSSFDQDLSGWDVSNLTSMSGMFEGCSSFNQDLSSWDTSNVEDMSYMFYGCSSFNQDLSEWCVSNITSEPSNFSDGATSWTLPKPIWGTCP